MKEEKWEEKTEGDVWKEERKTTRLRRKKSERRKEWRCLMSKDEWERRETDKVKWEEREKWIKNIKSWYHLCPYHVKIERVL